MDFKRVYNSSKTYIILLIAAIALLLFTISMAYRQVMLTEKSAEMVVHTLHVYNAIGDLTAHYTKAKSEEFRGVLLKKDPFTMSLKAYRLEGKAILDTLYVLVKGNDVQLANLKPLDALLNLLYDQIQNTDKVTYPNTPEGLQARQLQETKINNTLDDIWSIKNRMLANEGRLMQEREADYSFHKSMTPNILLALAFLAILIFVISFFRVYQNKLRIKRSEAFLQSVLATTDNIVNYYKPIFNDINKIIDFKIIYANDCNRDYLGLEPRQILNKTVLNVYPFYRSEDELEELIRSYNENTKVIFDRQIVVNEKKMWFHSVAIPLEDGLLVTSRNSTPEEEAKQIEALLKAQLENQNLQLLDNGAFLTNIFKSILHIVMHFKSIRDKDDKIIDFEILFINDRINSVNGDIPEEIRNKKISDIYPQIFSSGVFEHLVNAIENDKPVHYETPYISNGTTYWFRATAIKLGDGVTVTTRDVTEEKERADKIIQLNEELTIQNSILRDAERIAKTGSFIWYLDTGVSEISDNFYHLLGHEPKEFELNFEKYREFIHPEDLEDYVKNGARAIAELIAEEHTYRVVTKQGLTKHFKTNGQFISKNGNMVMLGVVQDVTQTIEAEEKLLKSNLELKNSNAELESFNRVASHDLQEPLRKIQLFILRIEDAENKNLSLKSKEHFSKVINAVSRMQSLIQNLLAYSRIDSSKKDFEKIDLNQILDKVKDDLTTTINETKAEIISDDLPKIKGVVFQMEQLFTNLIANALKYRKDNDIPKIQIEYDKVPAKHILKQLEKSKKYYHKISFKDNGIGFDPQYTDKIFEVFQRLHQKTEYSGTGIGLAICKKIVENHNGLIYAKGTMGVGAEFIICFPV